MLVSKYKNKIGEECVSIVIGSKELSSSKNNPNVFRITLSPSYEIHLDEKKKITIDKLFHLENLVDNTLKNNKEEK